MSLFNPFGIGLSALRAFRLGLDTTGYNIANATTPGFSRRRVSLSSLYDPNAGGMLQAGFGVRAEVSRVHDPFLDFAVRREMTRLGADDARARMLGILEPAFGPVDAAPLQQALSRFFDAADGLTANPENLASRTEFTAAARDLARTIRDTAGQLDAAREEVDGRIVETVDRVNGLLEGIARLNRQIAAQEAGGSEAANLRDERGRLLDELSQLVPARVVIDEQGVANVYLTDSGDALVTATGARPLQLGIDGSGMHRVLARRASSGLDVTDLLRGQGELGGLIETRDVHVAAYRSELDRFASALIGEVNARHAAGFDLDGNAGLPLFEPDPPGADAAGTISVNAAILADPRLVAAAGAAGAPGDNRAALALSELRGLDLAGLGGTSLTGFVSELIADVGRDVETASTERDASAAVVQSFEARRAEASGVSLDEEAAQLVLWQRSYEAAARFLQTVDEVTQVALQLGR
ncbi:MAG: flagellar hook-associated protein FlgK [Acidobacteriota bacterium]|nr:MAG: flagellar hook-associated protein FlgK [Acidobacteriota bacterium]